MIEGAGADYGSQRYLRKELGRKHFDSELVVEACAVTKPMGANQYGGDR